MANLVRSRPRGQTTDWLTACTPDEDRTNQSIAWVCSKSLKVNAFAVSSGVCFPTRKTQKQKRLFMTLFIFIVFILFNAVSCGHNHYQHINTYEGLGCQQGCNFILKFLFCCSAVISVLILPVYWDMKFCSAATNKLIKTRSKEHKHWNMFKYSMQLHVRHTVKTHIVWLHSCSSLLHYFYYCGQLYWHWVIYLS